MGEIIDLKKKMNEKKKLIPAIFNGREFRLMMGALARTINEYEKIYSKSNRELIVIFNKLNSFISENSFDEDYFHHFFWNMRDRLKSSLGLYSGESDDDDDDNNDDKDFSEEELDQWFHEEAMMEKTDEEIEQERRDNWRV